MTTKALLVLLSTITLYSEIAFAEASTKVTCELSYSKKSSDGITTEYKRGEVITITEDGTSSSNSGFTLNGKLEPICDSEGRQCDGNRLTATISKGKSKSLLSYKITPEAYASVSTALFISNEDGFVNCDITNQ